MCTTKKSVKPDTSPRCSMRPHSIFKAMIICSDLTRSTKYVHNYPHPSFILTVGEKMAAFYIMERIY